MSSLRGCSDSAARRISAGSEEGTYALAMLSSLITGRLRPARIALTTLGLCHYNAERCKGLWRDVCTLYGTLWGEANMRDAGLGLGVREPAQYIDLAADDRVRPTPDILVAR